MSPVRRAIPVAAAQFAGLLPVNVEELHADFLTAAGHQGLFAPPGIGTLFVRDGIPLATMAEGPKPLRKLLLATLRGQLAHPKMDWAQRAGTYGFGFPNANSVECVRT